MEELTEKEVEKLRAGINLMFDEKLGKLEKDAYIFTVLTHITPEQEKQGWELVEKIKGIQKQKEKFNRLVDERNEFLEDIINLKG